MNAISTSVNNALIQDSKDHIVPPINVVPYIGLNYLLKSYEKMKEIRVLESSWFNEFND